MTVFVHQLVSQFLDFNVSSSAQGHHEDECEFYRVVDKTLKQVNIISD